MSQEIGYRDVVLTFRRPTENDLIFNLWNPRQPPFDPVLDLRDLSQPHCPKFYYLKHVKGTEPSYSGIFCNPRRPRNNRENNYRLYFRHSRAYKNAIIKILKYIVWNSEGNILIDSPLNSPLWRELFIQVVDPERRDVIPYLERLFRRLQNQHVLEQYRNSIGKFFFKLQVFNPFINLPEDPDGNPYEISLRRTENFPRPYRYRWYGSFAALGIIPEINFERREIVLYSYYTPNFINYNQSSENFTFYEDQMFIIPDLHLLWLFRLALSSMDSSYLQQFAINLVDFPIFQTVSGDIPSSVEFARFNLRLETIDRTYTENLLERYNINLPLRTAQALNWIKLVHGRRPRQILNMEDYCLLPDIEHKATFCGLSFGRGCTMKDYVRIPKATVSVIVKDFQVFLRDEITLKSADFYYLQHFLRNRILELQDYLSIWLGKIKLENNDLIYENNEFLEDKIARGQDLHCAFWSPYLFFPDLVIQLEDREENTIINESNQSGTNEQSLRRLFSIFSIDNKLDIILGDLPTLENFRIYRRQQRAIWRANNFGESMNEDETLEDFEIKVLTRRLSENDRRAGEAIFGDRVRFI